MESETESCIYEILNEAGTLIVTVIITGNTSVTVEQIPVGTYSIREANGDWAWDYDDMTSKTFTVTANGSHAVLIENTSNRAAWLTAENSN